MAAAFLAMNEVYGTLFDASRAEAQTPEAAKERAGALSKQFVMDCHTHFLRDDTRIMGFVRQRRRSARRAGTRRWRASRRPSRTEVRELLQGVYLDSDTKVALISGAPSNIPQDWFLTNEMKAEARAKVNREAGARRMLSHAIFTPAAGWLEAVDRAIADSSPIPSRATPSATTDSVGKYPWRMDDEQVAYKAYEKFQKARLVNVCVHKGLFPPSVEQQSRTCWPTRTCATSPRRRRTATAQLHHLPLGQPMPRRGRAEDAWAECEGGASSGSPTSRRSRAPRRRQRYADLGQIFAPSTVATHGVCAAMMGQFVQGLGPTTWSRAATRAGPARPSGGWRRWAHGDAGGPAEEVRLEAAGAGRRAGQERAILGENNARLYKYDTRAALQTAIVIA